MSVWNRLIQQGLVRSFSNLTLAQNTPMHFMEPTIGLEQLLENMRLQSIGISAPGTETASENSMELLNRNARKPKKANRGKRPCSHVRRRAKRKGN